MTASLDKELEAYRNQLPSLAGAEGQWVVIRGEKVLGVFPDYGMALQAGYAGPTMEPFLVKRIERVDSGLLITRILAPCLR